MGGSIRGERGGWVRHPFEWLLLVAGVALLVSLAFAPHARGSFHIIKIREISGEGANANSAYIELQMYAGGENFVSGHNITLWNAAAFVAGSAQPVATLPLSGPNPPNGQNQRTILVGDTAVAGSDFTLDFSPYLATGAPQSLVPAGAVCYEAIPIDCVSWGGMAFTGANNLPDDTTPYGNPLPVTFALQRRIDRGCPTLLEAVDDTNDAGSDFQPLTPRDPTPNSAIPFEQPCGGNGGGGGVTPRFCGGRRATKVGTAGPNVLVGTAGRDVITGLGGRDVIRGLAGNDVLCGGRGRDRLIGGGGRDRLLGQVGRDTCLGGPKRDVARTCEVKRTI